MKDLTVKGAWIKWGIGLGLGASLALGTMASSCGGGNSSGAAQENANAAQTEKMMVQDQPPPIFNHSDIRATAIEIEAIQALGENTTSFAITNDGKLLWSCPSLGEPVHATDQITNPWMATNASDGQGHWNTIPVGQMDPNGIYAGPSTGTYALCVDSQGRPYAHYFEGYMDVVSGPATWNGHGVTVTGAPTMPTCSVKVVGKNNDGTDKRRTVCAK